MIRDSFYTKRLGDKIRVWFGKTAWRPDDMLERFPSNPNNIPLEEKYNPEPSSKNKWFARRSSSIHNI